MMIAFDTINKTASVATLPFRKPLLAFFLLVFLIGAAGYAIFEQYKKSIIEKEVQNLGAFADLKVEQIASWRDRHRQRAEFFAHGAMLPDAVKQWLREGAPANTRKQKILKTLDGLLQEQGYKTVLLLDKAGAVKASTNGQTVTGADETKFALEAMRSRQVLLSDFRMGGAQGKNIVITIVAPLIAFDGKNNADIVGALLLITDPYNYLYPAINTWPTPSKSAETLLVRRDGDNVLFLNELRHQKGSALSLRIPLTNTQLPAAKAVLGETEVTEGNDYRGVSVVAALRRIPDTSWFMVAKVDKDELFAPVYQLKQWTAVLGFAFTGLAAILLLLWYRGAAARYRQLQVQHAAAMEREFLLKHFEYLTRFANDMIIVGDETGRIVEVNERVLQALGYSRDELLQMHIPDLHEPLDSQAVPGQFDILATKGEMRSEGIYMRKDGSTFAVEISARSIEVEGKRYLHGIVSDISERKAAEALLRSREAALAEFKYTLDQTLDCVFIFQPDTLRFTYVNEGAMSQVGHSEAELLQMTPMDIKPVMPEAYFCSMVQPLLDGSLPALKFETIHRHKDGHAIPVEVNMQLVRKTGQEPRFVELVRDITERKLIETELLNAKEQAERASQAKSEFLSHMSHQLRTPLNSIIGFAQIMESSADDETIEAHRENLKTIISSGWHLVRIIENLLNLSAIEAGKIELNIENIDIRSCMQECLELMAPLVAQKMIDLHCADDEFDGVLVRADAFRLKQVLINLLANATKFNRIAGSITISSRRKAGYLRILVTDTGPGIAEDDLSAIFQPFSQLANRPNTIEGAGIGLSISKQLIELMHGKIGVESIRYLGSKFWIELPLAEVEATVSKPAVLQERSVAGGHKTSLLYIEDNPDHIKLMKKIISRMGDMTLLTAHTPRLGIDLARAHRPDIILLDICLPGINGYEVLEILKSSELTHNIPVIAISAASNPAEIETGLHAGFRRYLSKPLQLNDFKRAVGELLRDRLKV
jgi:PAS domain S-box-containing protein